MGYFSNGTESYQYVEDFCMKCKHYKIDERSGEYNCPILEAHAIFNYIECNNKRSILHILIPRDDRGYNKKCKMFTKEQTNKGG